MELRDWGPARAKYPKALVELYEGSLQACTECSLGQLPWNKGWRLTGSGSGTTVVFVVMSPSKQWTPRFRPGHVLFGRDTENERNERVFLDALNALGLSRDDVYVTNLLKCAPERSSLRGKEDRNAIATCVETILHAELTLLQPRLLVAVGEPAQRIFRVRVGQRHELKRDGWPTMEVAAMWHPGALWRRRKQIPEPLAFYVEQMRKALASWANEIESRHRGQKEMAGQQSPRSAPTP